MPSPHYRRHKDLIADTPQEKEAIRRQLVADGHLDYLTVKEAREYVRTGHLPTEPLARHATGPVKTARSPWTWPLVALIVLLMGVLGGSIAAILAGGGA